MHDQTVDVYVDETSDEFSPVPDIDVGDTKGAICNGDGSFQVKGGVTRVLPIVERIGDGLFGLSYPDTAGSRVPYIE